MPTPTSTKFAQLRLGIESGERQQDGVLVFDDIPVGATVFARVDRPTELVTPSDEQALPTEVVSSGGRTLTFADANPDTITASSGSFITDGYKPGMKIVVGGTTSNDGAYVLADVTATVLTLTPQGSLTAEGPLSGGETIGGVPQVLQGYTFELAPPPAAFTVGGVAFNRQAYAGSPPYVPSAANPGSRQRTLLVGSAGDGTLVPEQREPLWAAFATPVGGALAQKGKAVHMMVMPGHPTLSPALPPEERNLLRVRWLGSPVTGATLVSGMAAATSASGLWASGHENLVPGSIVLTLPTSGGPLRDNGKGRLVGDGGDGVVNYLTGEFSVTFTAAQTGDLDADYEHECLYRPLDVTLTFDPLQAV